MLIIPFSAIIYLFKCNNKATRKRCEICPRSTKKTPERHEFKWTHSWRYSGVFLFNLTQILLVVLLFLILSLNYWMLLPTSCFYGSSQWLFKVRITCKRASFFKNQNQIWLSVSYHFCYPSFLLWSIFRAPFDVQLKLPKSLCLAYPHLIFLRVNWCQNI